jgi:hypothetical protein
MGDVLLHCQLSLQCFVLVSCRHTKLVPRCLESIAYCGVLIVVLSYYVIGEFPGSILGIHKPFSVSS